MRLQPLALVHCRRRRRLKEEDACAEGGQRASARFSGPRNRPSRKPKKARDWSAGWYVKSPARLKHGGQRDPREKARREGAHQRDEARARARARRSRRRVPAAHRALPLRLPPVRRSAVRTAACWPHSACRRKRRKRNAARESARVRLRALQRDRPPPQSPSAGEVEATERLRCQRVGSGGSCRRLSLIALQSCLTRLCMLFYLVTDCIARSDACAGCLAPSLCFISQSSLQEREALGQPAAPRPSQCVAVRADPPILKTLSGCYCRTPRSRRSSEMRLLATGL